MAFMEPQIFGPMDWFEVDDGCDSYIVPAHHASYADRMAGTLHANKYGARLSAPGYLDCTDWCLFDTEREAADYLSETFEDCDAV